jgi:chromosome partitioning protein
MGRIICVANRKGGVGKTTLLLGLAKVLTADEGKSMCVVDTDPQASATASLVPDPETALKDIFLEKSLTRTGLDERRPVLSDFLRQQVSLLTNKPDVPLSLVPCSPKLWALDDKLREAGPLLPHGRTAILRRYNKLLRVLRQRYDYVLVDTPPGRGLLSDATVKAADLVLVPSNPTALSTWGLNLFAEELQKLGAIGRARLIWTLYTDTEKWRDFAQGYERTAKIRSIRPARDSVGHFKRLVGLQRGVTEHRPMTFIEAFGQDGAALLSEIATLVTQAAEENTR